MSDKESSPQNTRRSFDVQQRKKSRSRSPNDKTENNKEGDRYRNKSRNGNEEDDRREKGNYNRNNQNRYNDRNHRRDYDRGDKRDRYGSDRGRRGGEDGDRQEGRHSWENSKVRQHANQIQQRKLLWNKPKEEEAEGSSTADKPSAGKAEKAWSSMLAAATTDSKELDKYQRLMGIKKGGTSTDSATSATKEVKEDAVEAEKERQRKMQEGLEQQYAMARASTHMARGRGLGF
jgi:hypothetical protein